MSNSKVTVFLTFDIAKKGTVMLLIQLRVKNGTPGFSDLPTALNSSNSSPWLRLGSEKT